MFNNENGIAGFKLFQLLSFCIQKFKAKITLLEIEKNCLFVAKHLNKSTRTKYTRPCNKKHLGNLPSPPYPSTPHPNVSVKVLSSGWKVAIFLGKSPGKLHQSWRKVLQNSQNRNNKTWSVRLFCSLRRVRVSLPWCLGYILLKFRVHKQISGKYDFPLHFFPSADLSRVCLICLFLQAVLGAECCRSSF